ncbi:MAG: 2-dehydro-3-deoxyphosphogluconate aldolase [Bdellovibrio sp.]|nr:MAG: 2-dehydro-3-deoxyphosphogluconate aldolase [Bdellovibrio sp.]
MDSRDSGIDHILQRQKLLGVLRAESAELAVAAAEAAFRGGLQIIEVTFTVPQAPLVIEKLSQLLPNAVIGAGSLTTVKEAQEAQQAGARFFVSPHLDPALCRWFFDRKLFYIPGALTPSELMAAHAMGAPMIKLFPAQVYGAGGVKSLLAPLPFLQLMVTGGVTETTAKDFLQAGAKVLSVGREVFAPEALAARDWQEIELRAGRFSRLMLLGN